MSATKRDTTTQILRYLRVELKEIDMAFNDEGLLPEPGEIRALLAQLESLLEVVQGVKKRPSPNTPNKSI